MNRRDFMKTAFTLSAASCWAHYEQLTASDLGRVRITDIKAMMLKNPGLNTLIKVETDAGLVGYGESGTTGMIARARIESMRPVLVGQDPLAIEQIFHNMTTNLYPYMPHIPTVSGIDIALWDLAGKITGLPIYRLLGGPFRDRVRMYLNTQPPDMLDPGSCREWSARMKEDPAGWTTLKLTVTSPTSIPPYKLTPMASGADIRKIGQAFANVREALGPEMEIIAHCHNEFDLPSAFAISKVIEPANPLFLEDPIAVPYSESWIKLREESRVAILTGEKLELSRQFLPFLQHQATDAIHPDLAYAGGFTGTRQIANLAAIYRIPVVLHNVGMLPLTMASVHFGASIHDFAMSENLLGRIPLVTDMAVTDPPIVKNSHLDLPSGPGLGIELNPDVLRANMVPGEPWWG